jgi:hypothetical protein
VRPPELALACLVANRLKRDGNLNYIPGIVEDALGFHQDVYTEILATSLREHAISLDAQWIEKHFKSFALVVECVEIKPYIVVPEDVVALSDRRAHLVRFVESTESNVKEFRVVTD